MSLSLLTETYSTFRARQLFRERKGAPTPVDPFQPLWQRFVMPADRSVSISMIGVSDVARIRALARRIWPECFAGILPTDIISPMVEAIYDLDVLRADIEEQGHICWIAQVEGEDAGYCSAYREANRLWIKKLYLLDSCRGLGLGKRLIAIAQQELSGAKSLALYVNDGNASAIAFYQSQGFAIDKLVPVNMGGFEMKDYVMVRPMAR